MAELMAKHLLTQKVRTLLVSNRTFEHAQTLSHAPDRQGAGVSAYRI